MNKKPHKDPIKAARSVLDHIIARHDPIAVKSTVKKAAKKTTKK